MLEDTHFKNTIKNYILLLENESSNLVKKLESDAITEDDISLFARSVTTLQVLIRSYTQWNSTNDVDELTDVDINNQGSTIIKKHIKELLKYSEKDLEASYFIKCYSAIVELNSILMGLEPNLIVEIKKVLVEMLEQIHEYSLIEINNADQGETNFNLYEYSKLITEIGNALEKY